MSNPRSGFTLIELLIVVAIIGILAAVAVPSLMRARIAGNESSAIGSVRNVNSGQQAFWSSCGAGKYSPSLQNLGLSVAGAAGYIAPDLSGPAPINKSGYVFDMGTVAPSPETSCNGGTVALTYHVTADALPGRGRRYFGSNGAATVFESSVSLFGLMPDTGVPPAPAIPLAQ